MIAGSLEQRLAELKRHHADLAKRIVGTVGVDESHLTEDPLLTQAREFYVDH